MSIKLIKGGKTLDFKEFTFPGGEVGVKLNVKDYAYREYPAKFQTIVARLTSSEEVIKLAMVKDALEKFDNTPIQLFMPYVPYARQDRVCDSGESLSLKVFCNLINGLGFQKVTIVDPHSEVTPALLNNVSVISQFDVINGWQKMIERCLSNSVIISPDAGANKKSGQLAGYFGKDLIRADKLRDLTNGNIKETIVYCDDFNKKDVIVFDDICDGGRTFIELAKVCKAKNCGKFVLYVTHGIFSKGIITLLEQGIDEIWFTNSFREKYGINEREVFLDFGFKPFFKDGRGIGLFNLEEKFL